MNTQEYNGNSQFNPFKISRIVRLFLLIICLSHASAFAAPALIIDGLDGIAKTNVEATVNLSRYSCENSNWQLKRLQDQITKESILALQAVGYYNSSLETSIERAEQDACWKLRITATPGPRVVVSGVAVEIIGDLNTYDAVKSLVRQAALQVGDPLNHQNYNKTKTDIEVLAARFGYFEGKFTEHELVIDPNSNTAKASLVFESGQSVSFGEVKVSQEYIDANILNDYILISPGDKFDSHQLINQQQVLLSSGYFSQVNVTVDKNNISENRVPVNIDLASGKRFSYRFGIGASTDTGPRVSFDYTDRRVNKAGHRFKSSNSFSEVRSEITANYSIPQGKAGTDRIDLQLGYLFEETDNARYSSYKFSASDHKVLSNKLLRTFFLEYLYEDFTTPDSSDITQFVIPGMSLRRSKIDNPVFPRDGWRLNSSLRIASEDIFSSTNLVQFYIAGKLIKPLGSGRILTRFDAGFSGVENFSKIPVSLRFYAGGDGSVRGFDYKSLGPKNTSGEVTGGQNLLAMSVEYEHPLADKWGLAAFVDSGNAFNNFNQYELFTGAGVGIRWHSPIGPIRLDLAQDIEGDRDPRLHLSMGLDL